MKRLKVLYFSGILLIAIFAFFIYSNIIDTTRVATPIVKHSSVKTDQGSFISFTIYNNKDRDLNYTYTISLDGERLTKDNPVLVKSNRTFRYSIQIPQDKVGSRKANVLIYSGIGEDKKLIENKTYYLK